MPTNLVMQGFRMVCEKAGRPVPAVHLVIDSEVPVARGLGSSSTCIAGGMAAANAMLGNPFTTDDLFQLCTAFEGHPDNAAPAFLGGLTASFMHEGRAVAVPFSPDPAWRFVAVIPNYEVRTEEARRIVRRDIDLSAAVHTMSHAIAMVRGLETGDEALVGAACADVLHEPYRRTLIAEYNAMRAMALEAGAATFFISGSGSTMIAATKSEAVAEAFVAKVRETWPDFARQSAHRLSRGHDCHGRGLRLQLLKEQKGAVSRMRSRRLLLGRSVCGRRDQCSSTCGFSRRLSGVP